jgi:hypothetical protein
VEIDEGNRDPDSLPSAFDGIANRREGVMPVDQRRYTIAGTNRIRAAQRRGNVVIQRHGVLPSRGSISILIRNAERANSAMANGKRAGAPLYAKRPLRR